jgi:hypothetical protein
MLGVSKCLTRAVRPLPSPISATGCPALFDWFIGTTEQSDSSNPFTRVVRLLPAPAGLVRCLRPSGLRSPGSRACSFSACAGSTTTQNRPAARVCAAGSVAFPLCVQGRRPDLVLRSSIPGPPMPLSTLRSPPHSDARKTRGQDGSLLLVRLFHSLLHAGLSRRTRTTLAQTSPNAAVLIRPEAAALEGRQQLD